MFSISTYSTNWETINDSRGKNNKKKHQLIDCYNTTTLLLLLHHRQSYKKNIEPNYPRDLLFYGYQH